MEKVFKSKIDINAIFWSISPFVLGLLVESTLFNWVTIPLMVLGILSIILEFTTNYIISDTNLLIKVALFGRRNIEKSIYIMVIKKIKKSNNFVKAPVFSMERLEIEIEDFSKILISPENKEEFIKDLLKTNPSIQVEI